MSVERFKSIFAGLDRAHGVTIVGESNGNGAKVKGKSFVKREPVTDELWQKHLEGVNSLGVIPILARICQFSNFLRTMMLWC